MTIYNQDKSQILTNIDLTKGHLEYDVIHHEEQQATEGKYHFETINKYAHGESVKRVYDEQPQSYQPAYDETIVVYIPYTEKELQDIELNKEMQSLKEWFNTYYAQHEQKYRRLQTLNKLTDDGKDPNQALRDLYFEAEEKRKRIQELEAQIQSLSKSKP